QLKLEHTLITREVIGRIPPLVQELLRVNTYKAHIPGVAYAYKVCMLKGADSVHVRSNLSEIGRLFYKSRNIYPRSAEELVYLWTPKQELHTPENITSFEDFAS